MIGKVLAILLIVIIASIISITIVTSALLIAELHEDMADWIREKVFKKKRGAK